LHISSPAETLSFSPKRAAFPARMDAMASLPGSGTKTSSKRRFSALSFPIYIRYSSVVVARITGTLPLVTRGLSMLPMLSAPPDASLWASSMKKMTPPCLAASFQSPWTFFSRELPAEAVPFSLFMSISTMTFPMSPEPAFRAAILPASSRTRVVFPTPGFPVRMAFLRSGEFRTARRCSTCFSRSDVAITLPLKSAVISLPKEAQ